MLTPEGQFVEFRARLAPGGGVLVQQCQEPFSVRGVDEGLNLAKVEILAKRSACTQTTHRGELLE